jgi:hypothetical protein
MGDLAIFSLWIFTAVGSKTLNLLVAILLQADPFSQREPLLCNLVRFGQRR